MLYCANELENLIANIIPVIQLRLLKAHKLGDVCVCLMDELGCFWRKGTRWCTVKL